jgi:hypothetical protein
MERQTQKMPHHPVRLNGSSLDSFHYFLVYSNDLFVLGFEWFCAIVRRSLFVGADIAVVRNNQDPVFAQVVKIIRA